MDFPRIVSAHIHRLLLDPHFSWTRTLYHISGLPANTTYILKSHVTEILRIRIHAMCRLPHEQVYVTMIVDPGGKCIIRTSTGPIAAAVKRLITAGNAGTDYGLPAGKYNLVRDELHRAYSADMFSVEKR